MATTARSIDEQQDSPAAGLAKYAASFSRPGGTVEKVTEALRDAILDGTLPPMTWLREEELAREFNVSRTPIREALSRLTAEGLTVRHRNIGTVVSSVTGEDILALYVVRGSLEAIAARLAAGRGRSDAVDALRKCHQAMVDAAARNATAELVQLNLTFHRIIREAAANPYVDRFLDQVELAVRRFGSTSYEIPGRAEETLIEHERILTAIEQGDADQAAIAARDHIKRAREVRAQMLFG